MALKKLLGNISPSEFLERYFYRFPFSLPGMAQAYCALGTWEVFGGILGQSQADVMVARDGQPYSGKIPESLAEAKQLSGEGYTVLVRHAERHHEGLGQLASDFEEDFRSPVDIHLYATPGGKHGFGWHFDAEDVFILQTGGTKEYSLRKNTIHPWPLVETLAGDMRYPREIMPLMRVCLEAGDWLYIPCGYWHKAQGRSGDATAISLAVGVMSPAAIHLLDFARQQLVRSLVWRQRLPPRGNAAGVSIDELVAQHRAIIEMLADDLLRKFRDDQFVRDFLTRE